MGGRKEASGATIRRRRDKEPISKTEAMSWKREDIRRALQEGARTGRIFRQDAESEGLDIVEVSGPSETEKTTAHRVRVGNVGAPGTLGNLLHRLIKEG
jgi:hypothetical protein